MDNWLFELEEAEDALRMRREEEEIAVQELHEKGSRKIVKPIVILSGEAARKLYRSQNLDRQAEAVQKARKELKKAGYRL